MHLLYCWCKFYHHWWPSEGAVQQGLSLPLAFYFCPILSLVRTKNPFQLIVFLVDHDVCVYYVQTRAAELDSFMCHTLHGLEKRCLGLIAALSIYKV